MLYLSINWLLISLQHEIKAFYFIGDIIFNTKHISKLFYISEYFCLIDVSNSSTMIK